MRWALAWLLFWMGDLVSKPMSEPWEFHCLYPVYNRLNGMVDKVTGRRPGAVAEGRRGLVMADIQPCGYKVKSDSGRKPCGAKATHQVLGTGSWGGSKVTPVCPEHIGKAMGDWNWDSVEPLEVR